MGDLVLASSGFFLFVDFYGFGYFYMVIFVSLGFVFVCLGFCYVGEDIFIGVLLIGGLIS